MSKKTKLNGKQFLEQTTKIVEEYNSRNADVNIKLNDIIEKINKLDGVEINKEEYSATGLKEFVLLNDTNGKELILYDDYTCSCCGMGSGDDEFSTEDWKEFIKSQLKLIEVANEIELKLGEEYETLMGTDGLEVYWDGQRIYFDIWYNDGRFYIGDDQEFTNISEVLKQIEKYGEHISLFYEWECITPIEGYGKGDKITPIDIIREKGLQKNIKRRDAFIKKIEENFTRIPGSLKDEE